MLLDSAPLSIGDPESQPQRSATLRRSVRGRRGRAGYSLRASFMVLVDSQGRERLRRLKG